MSAQRRQGMTGCDMKGAITDGRKQRLSCFANGLRDRAAGAKPTPGWRIYGTGEIADQRWRRNAATRIHAQAGRYQCPRIRVAGGLIDLFDRSNLHNLA